MRREKGLSFLRQREREVAAWEAEQARLAVRFARKFTDNVEFSPEDAGRSEEDFLCKILEAVIDAGATTLNIPDTVGYATPQEMAERIRRLPSGLDTPLSASGSPLSTRQSATPPRPRASRARAPASASET